MCRPHIERYHVTGSYTAQDVEWPTLPEINLERDLALPSLPTISLPFTLQQLQLKFPDVKFPKLPSLPTAGFPDWELPVLPSLLADLQLQLPHLDWPTLPQVSLPAFRLPELFNLFQMRFPELDWPHWEPPDLDLRALQLPSLHLPSLHLPTHTLPSLGLTYPKMTMPDLNFDLPALEFNPRMPDVRLPVIRIPSIGFPEVALDMNFEACMPPGALCEMGGAFFLELLDDLLDLVLVFGFASLLAKKAVVRKRRERAMQTVFGLTTTQERSSAQLAAAPAGVTRGSMQVETFD